MVLSVVPACPAGGSTGRYLAPDGGFTARPRTLVTSSMIEEGYGRVHVEHDVSDEKPTSRELEGRYELVDLLSKGGMGAVHRARHRTLDRDVAVKFMSAELRDDPEMR